MRSSFEFGLFLASICAVFEKACSRLSKRGPHKSHKKRETELVVSMSRIEVI